MRSRFTLLSLLVLPVSCLLILGVYSLPPVHSRLAWRLENLWMQARYAINPPEQVVFVPQEKEQLDAIVKATMQAILPLLTPSPVPPSQTPIPPDLTVTPQPSPTYTPSATPLPEKILLDGVKHEFQQMNNCGPTTLAMALSFWGWQGDQTVTRAYLRPNFRKFDDKNVMPAEMVKYVETQTEWKALTRVGGDIEMLKRFIAAGFPVIIEKGLQDHPADWMGHYALVNGYDDERQIFITQDSYTGPGVNVKVPYASMDGNWWRDFNYVYLVIYPVDRQPEVLAILGPQADVTDNYRYAAQKAKEEIPTLTGRDQYFAWYNLGTNLVALQDYAGAAEAYDQAFAIYATIPDDDRPWRMLWYQVGPYAAYYYTGRYQDVIDLGNTTLNNVGKPILEETFYWLGMSREAQGDLEKAIYDYKKAVELNPNSTPAQEQLARLGLGTP